jgi:hypothetical protein
VDVGALPQATAGAGLVARARAAGARPACWVGGGAQPRRADGPGTERGSGGRPREEQAPRSGAGGSWERRAGER